MRRFVPAAVLFLFWVALGVSSVHSNLLAILVLLAAAALLLFGAWPQLRRLRHGEDFRVTLLDDEWDNFQYYGYILQAKLRVQNLTGRRKRITSHIVEFSGAAPAPVHGPGAAELRAEADARRHNLQQMNASVVDPHDTVGGWYVFTFGDVDPGSAAYKLSVTDEMNKRYEARRQPWFVRWFS